MTKKITSSLQEGSIACPESGSGTTKQSKGHKNEDCFVVPPRNDAFLLRLLSLFGLSLFLFTSCVRNSDMQTEGADFLQGVWVQDSIPGQQDMLQYTLHQIKFICDSMYTTLHVHSKVKNIPDSCYQDGNWTEYAKGVYVVRNDSIMVSGIYAREDGKQKVSGCHRQGQYLPRFKIAYQSPDSIVLESRYDQRSIVLRKTEEVECVPKRRWEY